MGELAPAAFLCDVFGVEVEVDEPEMGLMLLRRDAVGLALVRSANPGINATTAAYIGVTGVDDLHARCAARGAAVVAGLTNHPWGLRDFVVEIPGGHRLASATGSPSPARAGTPEDAQNIRLGTSLEAGPEHPPRAAVRSAASIGSSADMGATTAHGQDNRRMSRYLPCVRAPRRG